MSLKLNIKTFRSEIDTRLRRKGESYFSEGRIRKLIYNARGNVRAVVHGTVNYLCFFVYVCVFYVVSYY